MSDKVIRHYSRPYGDCRADKRLYFGGSWPWQQGAECTLTPPVPLGPEGYILNVTGLDTVPDVTSNFPPVTYFDGNFTTWIDVWSITSVPANEPPTERTNLVSLYIGASGWEDLAGDPVPMSGPNILLTKYLSGLPVNSRVMFSIGVYDNDITYEIPASRLTILSSDVVSTSMIHGPELIIDGDGVLCTTTDTGANLIYNSNTLSAVNIFAGLSIPSPSVNRCMWTIDASYPSEYIFSTISPAQDSLQIIDVSTHYYDSPAEIFREGGEFDFQVLAQNGITLTVTGIDAPNGDTVENTFPFTCMDPVTVNCTGHISGAFTIHHNGLNSPFVVQVVLGS